METKELEFIIIHIKGQIKSDPIDQAKETVRLSREVDYEVNKATSKCQTIRDIDGIPVSITGLSMGGITSVENIRITYTSNGENHVRNYTKKDFYKL